MKALLITHNSDAWLPFIKNIGLPYESEISFQSDCQVISTVQKLSALNRLMKNAPATLQIHLAVLSAEYFIAEGLERGEDLLGAAGSWQEYVCGVLDFQRRYRPQVKLFDLLEAQANPALFVKKFEYASADKYVDVYRCPDYFPLFAANYFVNYHPQFNSLNLRLLATCSPLSDGDKPSLNVQSIIQDYKNTKLRSLEQEADNALRLSAEKELKSLREEENLLLSQLHLVQEKLEEYHLQLAAEEKKNRDKIQRLNARVETAEYSTDILEAELSQYRRSIMWKLMAPMRVLSRLIKRESRSRNKLRQDINRLSASVYFDKEWYLKQYPDVAESNMNPAEHYLLYGADEGRFPSLLFDGNWYRQQYPDVVVAGINPLLHFLLYGLKEDRKIRPVSTAS